MTVVIKNLIRDLAPLWDYYAVINLHIDTEITNLGEYRYISTCDGKYKFLICFFFLTPTRYMLNLLF